MRRNLDGLTGLIRGPGASDPADRSLDLTRWSMRAFPTSRLR
jgi:hypothetical protein